MSPTDVARVKDLLGAGLERAHSADDLAVTLCKATSTLAQGEWPFFAAQAASYGIPAERLHSKAQLPAALRRMLATPGPYLLHMVLPARNQVYPLM